MLSGCDCCLCHFGCGLPGKYRLKNGNLCCSETTSKCPVIRKKNSEGVKKAYKEGRKNLNHFDGKRGWAKGKTAYSDERLKKIHGTPVLNRNIII